MVYGIPSNPLITKQQSYFYRTYYFRIHISTSLPSALLDYFDRFKSFVGQLKGALFSAINA